MSTGLSSYSNPQDIGPLYPGVDVEWLMVIVLVAGALTLWHVKIEVFQEFESLPTVRTFLGHRLYQGRKILEVGSIEPDSVVGRATKESR